MTPKLKTSSWREGTPLVEYQITRELDASPAGILYSAFHQQSHERAAIAVLRHLGARPDDLLIIEAAADVRHPNIAAIRELWRMDELCFLVTEFPEAQPLSAFFAATFGDLPGRNRSEKDRIVTAARITRDISSALSHAHDMGVAHGDLRPDDVLVKKDASAVLFGLGWAALLEREGSEGPEALRSSGTQREDVREAARILYGFASPGPDGLPAALNDVVSKALSEPDCSAAELTEGLDRFLSSPRTRSVARRSASGLKAKRPKRKITLSAMVLATALVGILAVTAMTWLFPNDLRKLSLKRQSSTFLDRVERIRSLKEPGLREAELTRLLSDSEPQPATAPARAELGRVYMTQRRYEDALREFFAVHYLDPSCFIGGDLLDLASELYESGRSRAADRVLDRIIDSRQGTELSWKALLMKKRIVLHREALVRLSASLDTLLHGPLKRHSALAAEAVERKRLADRLSLKKIEKPGRLWAVGDFLDTEGDEIAAAVPGRLVIAGRTRRVEIPLDEDPVCIGPVTGRPGLVFVGFPSGCIELHDAGRQRLVDRYELIGRLQERVIEVKGFKDQRRLVLSVADADGVNLAVVSDSSAFFHFKALGISALFAADLEPGVPGEELGVVVRYDDHDRFVVLGLDSKIGEWAAHHEQKLAGSVAGALLLENPLRILIGMEHNGIYSVENGGATLMKSLGASILDACAGDFDGDGVIEAAFLVRFPGRAAVEPETRILFYREPMDFTWIECNEAEALDSGDVNGAPGDELIVDLGSKLLEVSWR